MQRYLPFLPIILIIIIISHFHLTHADNTDVIKNLEERLLFASKLLGASDFMKSTETVNCPCEKYCTGQCFSSGCIVCTASTWNFPGGESLCYSPGPLGSGLLCQVNRTSGKPTENPCCNSPKIKSTCTLDGNSCCASGDCSTCPSYKQVEIFPSLKGVKRQWNNQTSECTDV